MTAKPNNKILFITQWQYEDALIQTYTLPYVQIIKKLTGFGCYLICVNKGGTKTVVREENGVTLIVLPFGTGNQFVNWGKNLLALRKLIKTEGITHLHPWCTPAGSIGLILKLLNRKLILTIDSFEPHAEAMVENGTWKKGGLKNKVLSYMEKLEAKKADNLVFAAPGMQEYILHKYGVKIEKFQVKPACVDLNQFSDKAVKDKTLLDELGLNGKIVGVYAGKFGGIYLEDESFQLIKKCEGYWGERFRFVLLSNVHDDYLKKKTEEFGIRKETIIKLFVAHENIAKYIGLADFAICPVKPVPTKQYCSPIKDGEYWAMGLPVVITRNISVDSQIIADNNAGAVLQSLDDESYITAIKKIDSIIATKSREEVYKQIRPLAEKYRNYSIAKKVYTAIYTS